MPPTAATPFRCEVTHEHGSAHVRLVRELDLATTPILRAEIAALRETGSRALVLDLSGLELMDSTGLRCASSPADGLTPATP
jgi:anti-anti-sigma factor